MVIYHSDKELKWNKKAHNLYFFIMAEAQKSLWLKAALEIQFAFLRIDLLSFA